MAIITVSILFLLSLRNKSAIKFLINFSVFGLILTYTLPLFMDLEVGGGNVIGDLGYFVSVISLNLIPFFTLLFIYRAVLVKDDNFYHIKDKYIAIAFSLFCVLFLLIFGGSVGGVIDLLFAISNPRMPIGSSGTYYLLLFLLFTVVLLKYVPLNRIIPQSDSGSTTLDFFHKSLTTFFFVGLLFYGLLALEIGGIFLTGTDTLFDILGEEVSFIALWFIFIWAIVILILSIVYMVFYFKTLPRPRQLLIKSIVFFFVALSSFFLLFIVLMLSALSG